MTAIIVGSGSTFKSVTAEALALEVITFLQNEELKPSSNSTGKDFVQLSYNLNTMSASAQFSIPASQSIDGAGQLITSASDYLQNILFTPGAESTFKSITLCQYFLEVVAYLQILENDPTKNPQSENNVSYSYDADNKVFTGSLTIPLTITFSDTGSPIISAKEYLL